jgi:hypothetical protein
MHTAAAVTVAAAPPAGVPDMLAALARGEALGTLAFSEKGSRSHFWAPVSNAVVEGESIRIRADKSWVTSAGFADVYVVSSGSTSGSLARSTCTPFPAAPRVSRYPAPSQDLDCAATLLRRWRSMPACLRTTGLGQRPPDSG